MRIGRYIALLTTVVLCVGIIRAEKIPHNFQEMFYTADPPTLSFPENNKTGVTDLTTYTCSGGGSTTATKARFFSSDASGYQLSIFMVGASSATVETTEIANLDSITIYYHPDAYKEMFVTAQEDGGEWISPTMTLIQNGQRGIKFPHVGNYKVKIRRSDENFYIFQIDYFTNPACHCLRVVSE